MVSFALRSLTAHGRRAALTMLAVVLGVSMITGTLIFTDTIDAAFHDLFGSSTQGASVIVTSRQDIASVATAPANLPDHLIRQIRHIPGVRTASGEITDSATIVGDNGKVLRTTGLPTLALSYMPKPFTGLDFLSGVPPRGMNQVAIDSSTAKREHFKVGDSVQILTSQPARSFRITGIVKLGTGTLGGSTVAVFGLPAAQQLYDDSDRVDRIYVAAEPKTPAKALLASIQPLISSQFVVRTNTAEATAAASLITDQLGILTGGLLAFGFIAVLVGAFVIFNTFSITVAQRVREFSILRALGAVRSQLLVSVLTEAAMIGVLGSLGGLLGGLLAALLIHVLFAAVGLDLPSAPLVLKGRTIVFGLGIGILVTIAAGLIPAVRATRAPALESLREGTAPRRARFGWVLRLTFSACLFAAGLIVILSGGGSVNAHLVRGAIGGGLFVLAVIALGPLIVHTLARIISWPVERAGGIVPTLARENARRNPGRTAISSSALIIGLALVLFVMIFTRGLRDSAHQIVGRAFIGDLTIQSQDGQSPIPAAATQSVNGVSSLLAVSSLKTAPGRLGRAGNVTIEGIDPTTIGQVYHFDWLTGTDATLSALAPGEALVERDTARAAHLKVGAKTTLLTDTGMRVPLRIVGIYSDRALLTGIAISRDQFDQIINQPRLQDIFIKLGPGANLAAAQSTVAQGLSAFPGVVVRSERQLADQVASRVNAILILFYALLVLSVVMSLLGIVNTLNLSVYERTRELGMLRAMGMTGRQARILIRNEGVITATIGAVVGVALGLLLSWTVIHSVRSEGIAFSPPWLQVLGVFVVGLLAGVLAAFPPARRASRLDVLAAIAHE